MATVSRQSAFWAVVALGLNTFTQDGGKVLGFPAEYSRALRLSPIVCIVDTLGILFSVAFFCYKTRSIKHGFELAARYRGLTEEERAEPRLERTWRFRLSVFAFGALPQAVKILGMGGVPLTKMWGMAYLVSFLVLEGLDFLQPRQQGDYYALEPYAAVLDKHVWLHGLLAVLTQYFCLLPQLYLIPSRFDFKCYLERSSFSPPPDLDEVAYALITFNRVIACFALAILIVLVTAYLFVTKPAIHHFERAPTPLLRDLVERTEILFLLVTFIQASVMIIIMLQVLIPGEPICAFIPIWAQMVAISLLLMFAGLPFMFNIAFEHRWFPGTFGLIRGTPNLYDLRRSERGERSFYPLFAILSFANIICYYTCIYHPSSTYKPPWTEYLG